MILMGGRTSNPSGRHLLGKENASYVTIEGSDVSLETQEYHASNEFRGDLSCPSELTSVSIPSLFPI
jgi:hypothetical protein